MRSAVIPTAPRAATILARVVLDRLEERAAHATVDRFVGDQARRAGKVAKNTQSVRHHGARGPVSMPSTRCSPLVITAIAIVIACQATRSFVTDLHGGNAMGTALVTIPIRRSPWSLMSARCWASTCPRLHHHISRQAGWRRQRSNPVSAAPPPPPGLPARRGAQGPSPVPPGFPDGRPAAGP